MGASGRKKKRKKTPTPGTPSRAPWNRAGKTTRWARGSEPERGSRRTFKDRAMAEAVDLSALEGYLYKEKSKKGCVSPRGAAVGVEEIRRAERAR